MQLDEQVGDGGAQEVRVEVRHDPSAGGSWSQGISGLLNWLGAGPEGRRWPGRRARPAGRRGRAGRRDHLVGDGARRLVVRSASELPLRVVPLAVTVSAPAGSRLAARAGCR